jgi:DNA-binding beta-propeller fold protein YncE
VTRSGRPIFFVLAGLLLALAAAHPAHGFCAGDCNGDHVVTIDELLAGVNMSLGSAVLTTCLNFDRNGDGEVTVDELIAAVTNALQGCAAQMQAFVVTTDFTTGSFGTVGLDSPHAVQQSSPQHQIFRDAVARAHDGLVYVINRLFADNIQVLDPANKFATELECSTGNGTNPHDIAFVDAHKAYVSLFETPKLLIVNPSAQPNCKDFVLGTIDLSSLADADGNPDMDQMAIVDGRLYVSLERLNVHVILRPPAENGAIAVIDTATDELLGGIELSGENPFSMTQGLTVRDGAIYVAEAGLFGVIDGGIERVDLQTQQAEGFFVTEQDLGGDITDFALVSDRLAYAIVSKPDFSTALVAFDPTTRQITNTLRQNYGFTLADIELNDRGELYLADRTPQASGVRIFRAVDGTPLTDHPLDVLLPPFEIVFIP